MAEERNSAKDYVFRYGLEPDGKRRAVYPDPLVEMIREQLENMLNIVIPVEGQREVRVDGFKLLSDRKRIYRIFAADQEFPEADFSSERYL